MSRKTTPNGVNNISSDVSTNTEDTKTIVEKINSRLLEPVQVRNVMAGSCTLNLGNNGSKENCKIFRGHQILPVKIQDLITIAPETRLFTGSDGKGTNAYLFIEDEQVREYLGFRNIDNRGHIKDQIILNDDYVLDLLNEKNDETFAEILKENFENNIPKIRLLEDIIRRNKFNDAKRIKYIENTLNINIRL